MDGRVCHVRGVAPFERRGGDNPYAVQDALQDMMGTYVGIARSADDLQTALAKLEELRARTARVGVEEPSKDAGEHE